MSSGSSVFSIIPPKRARIERFILVQTPISAHPPTAKCEMPNYDSHLLFTAASARLRRFDVRHIRSGGFNSGENWPAINSEYNSTIKTLPERSLDRSRTTDIPPELHTWPMNFSQRF